MKKIILWTSAALLILISFQFTISNYKVLQVPALDFSVLYQAGEKARSGENPYPKREASDFHTPPPSLLIFSLLPLFPVKISQTIWFIASFLSFTIGSYFLLQTLKDKGYKYFSSPTWWLIYFSLVLIFFPFRYNLGSGEVNNFLFLFLSLAFYFLKMKKNFWAALALSIGIIIKITPLFFLLVLLLEKNYQAIKWIIFLLLSLSLLTLLIFGPNVWINYWAVLPRYFGLLTPSYYNQSLTALFLRSTIPLNSVKVLIYPILLCSLAAYTILYKKFSGVHFNSRLVLWNIGILYTLIFSTFAWQHHFTIAIFPLITTFYLYSLVKMPKYFYLLTLLSYFLMGINIKNPALFSLNFFSTLLLSHVLWGSLLLLGLNYYLLFKVSKRKVH